MAPSSAQHQQQQTTTVFVRFIPPSVNIRRHHLEEVFSQIGPIKKSSVILPAAHKKKPSDGNTADDNTDNAAIAASSYGFVKYTTELDAHRAAEKLNHSNLKVSDTETVKLKVERASRVATTTTTTAAASKKDTGGSGGGRGRSHDDKNDDDDDDDKKKKTKMKHVDDADVNNKKNKTKSSKLEHQQQGHEDGHDDEHEENVVDDVKKTNRIIVRNLSFYAKKNHIRTALESQFGPILDIHIPTVVNNSSSTNDEKKSSTPTPTTHRGFCFVTFVHAKHAQDCLAAAEAAAASASASASSDDKAPPILIAKRPVSIALALNKTAFEHQKQKQKQSTNKKKSQHVKDDVGKSKISTDNALEKEEEEEDSDSDESSDSSSSGSNDDDSDNDKNNDNIKGSGDDDNSSDSEEESSSNGDDDDDKDDDEASQDSKDHAKVNTANDVKAVGENRTLFLRNLPFDATRHDLFQLFYKFGFITGIYLVKDNETGIPKGTAFVSFRDAHSIERALQATAVATTASTATIMTEQGQPGSTSSFVSQRDEQQQHQAGFSSSNGAVGGGGLLLNGRRIFVNLAVDKETAVTLTMDQKNTHSTDNKKSDGGAASGTTKDRRNLYLKGEGRVDNHTDGDGHETNAWDELTESDQLKRQRAWSDKNSKLRSPLFFINPTRLSIRNLAKDVDEVALKQLCVEALQRGLENKLVTAQDQIAHWKASGELSTRDILKRVQSLPDEQDVIPKFDEDNVRKYVTSVFIDCDFGKNKKEKISRGFGFVEFEHHAHALVCLREINNNTQYTQEYAIGGKHAVMTRMRQRKPLSTSKKPKRHKNDGDKDQPVKLPRLIVEFAVENIAKAKQQAEHRALQQANMMKQKRENREKSAESKTKEKKKSRGQRQREKKRQHNEAGDDDNGDDDDAVKADGVVGNGNSTATTRKQKQHATKGGEDDKGNTTKVKKVKPPKRQKVDQDEVEFSKLVASYKNSFTADTSTNVAKDDEDQGKAKKRWFE